MRAFENRYRASAPYPSAPGCDWRADKSSLYELDVERDGHLVADENATSFERRVPSQAQVFAIDLCSRRYCHAGIAPRIFRWQRWTFDGEYHLARDASNGEVTLYGDFSVADGADAGRLERERGKLLHVEEVGALQMRIALG